MNESEKACDDLWTAFHTLWGKTKVSPTYSKGDWKELEGLIVTALRTSKQQGAIEELLRIKDWLSSKIGQL